METVKTRWISQQNTWIWKKGLVEKEAVGRGGWEEARRGCDEDALSSCMKMSMNKFNLKKY